MTNRIAEYTLAEPMVWVGKGGMFFEVNSFMVLFVDFSNHKYEVLEKYFNDESDDSGNGYLIFD